ncbi:MAG: GNAT family N-acetyltransferase [Caldilineales bacterium]|nr:GNAT family N-acetyltransferase [Caldilineales bacterium]
MAITSASITPAPQRGIRQIDLHRDLGAIADLIDEAFSSELDAAGRSSLRDMRTMARLGPLIYLMAPPGSGGSGFFRGFVWEEDGQIVGNVTIQQVDGYGRRWMLANVAVKEGYRGRGIGRALMEQAINRIRQIDGEWAILQVRRNNDIARSLYDHLGFSEVVTEVQLRTRMTPPASSLPLPDDLSLEPLYYNDWKKVSHLLRNSLPELARWWHPDRNSNFRSSSDSTIGRLWGQLTGGGYRRRLGAFWRNELLGVLDVDTRPRGDHRLDLLLHPHVRGQWEASLLHYGLNQLGLHPRRPVAALLYDYQPDAIATLEEQGFHRASELVTMRKRIVHHSERYRNRSGQE